MRSSYRDPAARSRLIGALTAMVVLWPLFQAAEVKPGTLFDAGNLKVITNFLAGFLPPEMGAEFLGYLAKATLETLAIATAGMALAFLIAVPLAYLASGAGREAPTLNPVTRALLTILRGIPELVWALIFVRVFGLGPAAGGLAITAMHCGNAVYTEAALIKARRNEMIANREETIAWLTKKGIEVQPGSQANMFMVNWKKPAKDMQAALLATPEKVQIGRSWAIWPTVSRVTVGSADDMAKFRAAVDKVYKA